MNSSGDKHAAMIRAHPALKDFLAVLADSLSERQGGGPTDCGTDSSTDISTDSPARGRFVKLVLAKYKGGEVQLNQIGRASWRERV